MKTQEGEKAWRLDSRSCRLLGSDGADPSPSPAVLGREMEVGPTGTWEPCAGMLEESTAHSPGTGGGNSPNSWFGGGLAGLFAPRRPDPARSVDGSDSAARPAGTGVVARPGKRCEAIKC